MAEDRVSEPNGVDDVASATAPKAGGHRSEKVVGWIDRKAADPHGRLVVYLWILLSGPCSLLLATVDTHYCAPRRQAVQERDAAIREGRYYEPKAEISIVLDACQVGNRDQRTIREVRLTRDFFRIDLTEPCSGSRSLGPTGWTHADALEPGSFLVEGGAGPPAGSGLTEVATEMATVDCPRAHDCVVAVECRAHYRRAADLKAYSSSAWAVFDPKHGPMLANAETLAKGTYDAQGGATAEWKDERHQRAFSCVKELLVLNASRDERFRSGDDAIRSLLPR